MRTEIENKIIELIYKELDNVTGKKIFHTYSLGWVGNGDPIYTDRYLVKSNCDESEYSEIEFINFALKFDDGEPNIDVFTQYSYNSREEPYKIIKRWFYKNKTEKTRYYDYNTPTEIICGHIRFELTSDETILLKEKIKIAYQKYLTLKDVELDKEVMEKIDLRLKK
jgi:hypothetical protein